MYISIDVKKIEEIIGYEFTNKKMLYQAFTRSSYSNENGGQNNEVLEFIGDKAIDNVVIDVLLDYYGKINEVDELETSIPVGQLSKTKSQLVNKTMLAHRIEILGLKDYLLLGKGDEAENIDDELSVKEDLFESIVGAVKMDSGNDYNSIYHTVIQMLDPYFYLENGFDAENKDYISIVYEYGKKNTNYYPETMYKEIKNGWNCLVIVSKQLVFEGSGRSKSSARFNACKDCYKYLVDKGYISSILNIFDIIGEPEISRSLDQFNRLKTKGFFESVRDSYREENGLWFCSIETDSFSGEGQGVGKTEARRMAAYNLLLKMFTSMKK